MEEDDSRGDVNNIFEEAEDQHADKRAVYTTDVDFAWRGPKHYQWQCPICRSINSAMDNEGISELECEECGEIVSGDSVIFNSVGYADEW